MNHTRMEIAKVMLKIWMKVYKSKWLGVLLNEFMNINEGLLISDDKRKCYTVGKLKIYIYLDYIIKDIFVNCTWVNKLVIFINRKINLCGYGK